MSLGLVAPLGLTAQAISGRLVLDSSGAPAARAVVVLISDSAQLVARTHADAKGIFGITTERPGIYRLGFFLGTRSALVSPPFALDTGAYLEREYRLPAGTGALEEITLAEETTKPVLVRPGQTMPEYPDGFARRGKPGIVRVLFVVNDAGDPQMETVQVIGASDEAFVAPVLRSLKHSRFWPAKQADRPVAQLMERTYDFGCPRDPPRGDVIIRTLYEGACGSR